MTEKLENENQQKFGRNPKPDRDWIKRKTELKLNKKVNKSLEKYM